MKTMRKKKVSDNFNHYLKPVPLERAINTDIEVRVDKLDGLIFNAMESLLSIIVEETKQAKSIERMNILATKVHMLLAMKGTHRSIRLLVEKDDADLDLSIDALPLTRVQLERCFLGLMIEDEPRRWYKRYCKNAWRAFAEKYFHDKHLLKNIESFQEHFSSNGKGISLLRKFAREMGVWEDELQTVRLQVLGGKPERRWPMRYIAQMPSPRKIYEMLKEPGRKRLAGILYPYYNSLSHFSHGGMVGIMNAAILRQGSDVIENEEDRKAFFTSSVVENTLPLSYLSILTMMTMFSASMDSGEGMREILQNTWQPYHSDGSPLGVAVWDFWAKEVLSSSAASEKEDSPSATQPAENTEGME